MAAERITAITPTKKDPQRVTIKVGQRVVARLSLDLVDELPLSVDQPWDAALAARVASAAALDKALRAGLQRLNRRALSSHDLMQKLGNLGFDRSTQQLAIDRLTDRGLLDDEAYGHALVSELIARRSAGPKLLRQKLLRKGLHEELIDKLVNDAIGEQDPFEQAVSFARKKLAATAHFDAATRQRRLYGHLSRSGFDADTIESVMNALQQDLQADDFAE